MDEQLTFEFEQRPTIKGFPELRWTGKRPYRSTQYYPAQLRESYGEEQNGWINKIFWGDNLQVMSHLLKEYRGKIDLIYIDPPFDSKADYKRKIEVKNVGKTTSDSSSFEEKQYGDMNRTPSRGQRKNIKFSRPAAIRCWPLFMRRGKACAFPSASGRPDCAGHVLCCNSEYTAGSSEQARAC